jgi:hypothetical protein
MRRDKSLEILDRLESEEDRVIRVLLDMVGQLERGWAAVQGEGIRKKGLVGSCVVGTDLGYFKTEEAATDTNDGF